MCALSDCRGGRGARKDGMGLGVFGDEVSRPPWGGALPNLGGKSFVKHHYIFYSFLRVPYTPLLCEMIQKCPSGHVYIFTCRIFDFGN